VEEALALVFGVKKFHSYLYGRSFTVATNDKALTTIIGPRKGIPPLAAACLQRWAVLLSAYHYQMEFKLTQSHRTADATTETVHRVE
jgi:hypothetical protein